MFKAHKIWKYTEEILYEQILIFEAEICNILKEVSHVSFSALKFLVLSNFVY